MNDFFDWLGLTKEEAELRAAKLSLICHFIDTQDPKETMTNLIGKVIGAHQVGDQLNLIVGYFIPGI